MAEFEIENAEGSHWVKCTLHDETVIAERGALSHLRGDIAMKGRIPGPIRMLRASISGEEVFRPAFSGTGKLFLQSSLGNFHVLELAEGEFHRAVPGQPELLADDGWQQPRGEQQDQRRDRPVVAGPPDDRIGDLARGVGDEERVLDHAAVVVDEVVVGRWQGLARHPEEPRRNLHLLVEGAPLLAG